MNAIGGNLSDQFDELLDDLDSLAPGACKDKAEDAVNDADAALIAAGDAIGYKNITKAQGKALKAILKARDAIESCD